LMGRPKLLVLDEPTNELDPHNRRLVWDMVSRRSAQDGTTVVLVTHNVLEAESAVDQVAVMNGGRITAMGTPGHLKEALGDRIRLELFVRDDHPMEHRERELFGAVGTLTEGKRDGSYLVQTDSARMPDLMRLVHGELGMDRVSDFRLTRPTLEDVYLTLDGRAEPGAGPAPGGGPDADRIPAGAGEAGAAATATAVSAAPPASAPAGPSPAAAAGAPAACRPAGRGAAAPAARAPAGAARARAPAAPGAPAPRPGPSPAAPRRAPPPPAAPPPGRREPAPPGAPHPQAGEPR